MKTINKRDVNREVANLACVRHVATGLYLVATERRRLGAHGAEEPADLTLTWNEQDVASVLGRDVAGRAASAYIALTGDSGVEIEPVECDLLRALAEDEAGRVVAP
jgi:hypothetical protein